VSGRPAPPILLASTSPQRRAILEQIGVPFEVLAPRYEEPPLAAAAEPHAAVREHALGKARSVAAESAGRPVLGVDTLVVCDGRVYGKPGTAEEAAAVLGALSGRTHEVVSGLCLLTGDAELVEHDVTAVTFRSLAPRDVAVYVAGREWEGRAGGYAIQGLGASLVSRVEGDYSNVVGLPVALLVRLLAERLAGVYGFG
jgi:septum formation protein